MINLDIAEMEQMSNSELYSYITAIPKEEFIDALFRDGKYNAVVGKYLYQRYQSIKKEGTS